MTRLVRMLQADKVLGNLELVTLFEADMPIGVVVSRREHIFINSPRLVDDDVEFIIAELTQRQQKNGTPVPYPNAKIKQNSVPPGEAKLVGIALQHNRDFK